MERFANNPERRRQLLDALERWWAADKHQRFGEMISKLTSRANGPKTLYIEDEQLLEQVGRALKYVDDKRELEYPF